MLKTKFIAFEYHCTLLGLTRKNRVKTDKLNENVEGVPVHQATTDLSADDPIYKAIRLKRQDMINYVKKNTLDWHGSIKLVSLEVTYFDKFKQFLTSWEQEFNELVERFLPDEKTYKEMIARAKENDPVGFDGSMYPCFARAKAKFHFSWNLTPLSTMSDVRLDAMDNHVAYIKEKAKADHDRNLANIEKQTQDRIEEAVRKIIYSVSSKCVKDKNGNDKTVQNVFQESSMLKHIELVEMLNSFNIGNNQRISDLIADFDKAMNPIKRGKKDDFESLRKNEDERLKVKADMESILAKFNI